MSEHHPSLAGIDPSLQTLGALQFDELVTEQPVYELAPHDSKVLPLDGTLSELAVEQVRDYEYVQLASINLGGNTPLCLWASKDNQGKLHQDTVMITPESDESLTSLIQQRRTVVIAEGQPPQVLGRRNEQVKEKLSLGMTVSGNHLSVALDANGIQLEDLDSTNGTTVIANRNEAADVAPVDRFQKISADPEFMALYEPGVQRQQEINAIFKSESARLQAALESGRHESTPDAEYAAEAGLTKLQTAYERARTAATQELDASIKPYLAKRLALQRGDTKAGYQQPEQLTEQDGSLVSARGKKVAWRTSYGEQYGQADIRLGQITLPSRLNSWGGGNGEKTNHVTGQKTNQTQHIIDLAAAMLSGNWKEEHEPIEIVRDTYAEMELPTHIRGKLPLYKVNLGMHRIAAMRLIEGIDGVADGVTVVECR